METDEDANRPARCFLEDQLRWSCSALAEAILRDSPGLDALTLLAEAVLHDDPALARDALGPLIRLATSGGRPHALAAALELLLSIRPGTRLTAWRHHDRLLASDVLHALDSARPVYELRELGSAYVLAGLLRYFDPDCDLEDADGDFAGKLAQAEQLFPVSDPVCLIEAIIRFLEASSARKQPAPPAVARAARRLADRFGARRVEARASDLAERQGGKRLRGYRTLALELAAASPLARR